MKYISIALITCSICFLTGCETIQGPDGSTRSVMAPAGMVLLEVITSTAIGAGTGALMNNSPGWATGAVGGAAGNIGSQVVNAFVPSRQNVYQAQPQQVNYPVYQPRPTYQAQAQSQSRPVYVGVDNPIPARSQQPVFTQMPDGRVVQVFPDGSFAQVPVR